MKHRLKKMSKDYIEAHCTEVKNEDLTTVVEVEQAIAQWEETRKILPDLQRRCGVANTVTEDQIRDNLTELRQRLQQLKAN